MVRYEKQKYRMRRNAHLLVTLRTARGSYGRKAEGRAGEREQREKRGGGSDNRRAELIARESFWRELAANFSFHPSLSVPCRLCNSSAVHSPAFAGSIGFGEREVADSGAGGVSGGGRTGDA